MRIIWYGHSCFWIETRGVKILIDPYPDVDDDLIGDVDYILITHEHTDHYGKVELLSRLRGATVIGPKPVYLMAIADGVTRVREISEGETIELGEGVKVTAFFMEHPSSQYPLGYLIEGDKRLFHTGDTYSFPSLQRLRGKVDVLLVPISGRSTANEREAAQIVEDIRPRIVIPMHYGTYGNGDPEKLINELRKNRIFAFVKVLKPGEEFNL
ncbi:MBL fold metallo-hydrolase [Thermococcus gammatolerans]|uniref:Metallo-beta-lactamase superfamily protein n=1 Tax=Thermococcus gammatolerans (strain DSM 15229 / JCM 11827 / EJ3) TaxID=593117 RepID=C5A2F8_THEGJ|nr:MBL fold metallo-hydrolase [Thermococcus gammatolerans]ACS34577.1 Metallo-beta-lactamase superfamily protein [Thermococcus gammatolerans EJ3]